MHVSYHWRNGACPGTTTAVWDGVRTSLAADVPAGAGVSGLAANVRAPLVAGVFCLQYDLVKEGVTWFSTQGAAVLSKTVTVSTPQYGVTWGADATPATMNAGVTLAVNVGFTNTGSLAWSSSGPNAVHLSYHWRNGACPGNGSAVWDGLRTALPADIASGAGITNLSVQVKAPSAAGAYCLQYDLVKEGVTWFSSQSASVLAENVTVSVPQNGVTWGGTNAPSSMAAGSTQSVNVTFTNAGSAAWTAGGANPVHLSYHWRNGACPGATSAVWDGIRTSLAANVAPGATVTNLAAQVKAPAAAGAYCLQFDLVKEGVAWFSTQGSPALSRTITVN